MCGRSIEFAEADSLVSSKLEHAREGERVASRVREREFQ